MIIEPLNITDEFTAGQIWRLQHAAYAVEAELIGFVAIPPLMDTIETIRSCGESFYGIQESGDIHAAIACESEKDRVTISRMMVHPDYFRRGYAKALISFVENRFKDASQFIVSTGSKNVPAIRLYESMGYTFSREWMPVMGLMITEFVKSGAKERAQIHG